MAAPDATTQPPIRVLFIDLSTRMGGASMRVVNLLQGMHDGQAALAGLHNSPVTQRAVDLGLEVHPVGRHKLDPAILKNLLALARTKNFKVFDTQNPQAKFWGTIAGVIAGVRIVSTLNSWYLNEHEGRWRGWFYHFVERSTMPWTDTYIVVSKEIKNQLKHYVNDYHKLSLIPNAIDLNMRFPRKNRAWLNAQFKLPENAIVCVAVGRLVEAKGYNYLIEALSLLSNKVHCLIIGEGHLKSQLMAQMINLGLDKRIQLTGYKTPEQLMTIVDLADIYVMSSVTEGTPLSMLEAAALAKPIVSTRVGGIPDVFHDRKQALLVTQGSKQQLADGIFWLIQHPAEANQMAMAGHDHIRKHYSLEAQVSATLESYNKAMENR